MTTTIVVSCALLAAVTMAAPNTSTAPALPTSQPVQDTSFQEIRRLWEGERYAAAFDRLLVYRSAVPYGKNEVVDYMIATSACRTGRDQLGRALFASILYHYSLDAQSRQLITRESSRCPPPAVARPVVLAGNVAGPVSSGTRGKIYYMLERRSGDAEVPVANQPVRILRQIPAAEFESRLFTPEQRSSAITRVSALWNESGVRVRSHGFFVIASKSHSDAALQSIANGMTAYLDFFVNNFGMQRPDRLITVYLTRTDSVLRVLARRLHGIEVAPQSIGYSFRNDQSMVGYMPDNGFGTLKHELFHLMVRRDFGDVPAWMDEGYAALYEVSLPNADGTVSGLPNWRGRVLKVMGGPGRSSMAEVLSANWREFDAQDSDMERLALNHAKARYFALYLQEKGKLAQVYRSFRQRDPVKEVDRPDLDAVRRIESVLNAKMADIDRDFAQWFARQPDMR